MTSPLKPRSEDIPFLRKLGWTIVVLALLVMVWRAADLLLLVFGSVLGAVMFRSAADLFRRIGIRNDNIALAGGIILSLALFGVIGWLLVVQFGREISGMLENLPGTLSTIEKALSTSPAGTTLVKAIQAGTGSSSLAKRLGDLVSGAGQVMLNLIIVIVGAMFLAANPKPYVRGLVLLTPPPGRVTTDRALAEVSIALRLWVKAKLISMSLMAILIGGSLYLAGLEHWAALGLLGGLSEFVPYVGPAVAMLPSIAIAAGQGGNVLWGTLLAYVFVRVVEAWLITPVVNRRVVSIPPALTLFTILAAGAIFGPYGLFFAGALLVVGFVGVRELYLRDTLGEEIKGVPRKARKEQGD